MRAISGTIDFPLSTSLAHTMPSIINHYTYVVVYVFMLLPHLPKIATFAIFAFCG